MVFERSAYLRAAKICAGIWLTLFFSQNSHADPLKDLDAVFMRNGGIDGFLQSYFARDQYYKQLLKTLDVSPEVLTYPLFYQFVSQLTDLVDKVPAIKSLAMETTGLGVPHTLQNYSSETKQHHAWQPYLQDWLKKLHDLAAQAVSTAEWLKKLETVAEDLLVIEKLPHKQRMVKRAEYFKSLKADVLLISGAARQLLEEIQERGLDRYIEGSIHPQENAPQENAKDETARLIEGLATLDQWKTPLPKRARFLILELTPSKKQLQDQTDLYSPTTSLTIGDLYSFKPIPRRFHGIWKGIRIEECVGGCSKHLEWITPRRWATALQPETQVYQIYKNGKPMDFVQILPIKRVSDGAVFGSVDFASPAFTHTVTVERTHDKFVRVSLVDAWVPVFLKSMPSHWSGITKSHSDSINNTGALPYVRNSLSYRFGHDLGSHREFTYTDRAFPDAVKKSTKLHDKASVYGSATLIFDADSSEEGKLIQLNDFKTIDLDSVQGIQSILDSTSDERKPRIWASLLQTVDASAEEPTRFLITEFSYFSPSQIAAIKKELDWDFKKGVFIGNPLLRTTVIRRPSELRSLLIQKRYQAAMPFQNTWLSRSLSEALKLYPVLPPKKTIQKILRQYRKTDGGISARRILLNYVRSPQDYIDLVKIEHRTPSKEYQIAQSNFVKETLEFFFSLEPKPTLDDVANLVRGIHNIDGSIAVKQRALKSITSAQNYRSVLKPSVLLPTEEYKEALSAFRYETVDRLLEFNPTTHFAIETLLKKPLEIQKNIELRKKLLPIATSASDYLDIWTKYPLGSDDPDQYENYMRVLGESQIETIDEFIKHSPSPPEMVRFVKNLYFIHEAIEARRKFVDHLRTARQYIELMTLEEKSPHEDYPEALAQLIVQTLPKFLALPGSSWGLTQANLLKIVPTENEKQLVRKALAQFNQSIDSGKKSLFQRACERFLLKEIAP